MAAIEANLDVIMNRMNQQERMSNSINEVGTVEGAEKNFVAN